MAGLHQPGDTVLHRLPVGAKVLGLAALSLAIVVVRDVRAAVVFLLLTLLLAALARVPLRSVLAGRPRRAGDRGRGERVPVVVVRRGEGRRRPSSTCSASGWPRCR